MLPKVISVAFNGRREIPLFCEMPLPKWPQSNSLQLKAPFYSEWGRCTYVSLPMSCVHVCVFDKESVRYSCGKKPHCFQQTHYYNAFLQYYVKSIVT